MFISFLNDLRKTNVTKQATFMVVFLAHSSRGITFYSLTLVSDKKLTAFFELFLPNPVTHPFLPRFQMSF